MEDKYSDASSSGGEHIVEDATVGMVQELAPKQGLVKECLVEGEGVARPTTGSKVSVHYVGTLADGGKKFDSSRDRDEPFTFELGKGSVIKGWDVGVATMRKNEKCILTCSPDFGYGSAGAGQDIPPNATLKFEVELLSWIDTTDISKDKDGSLMKKTIKDGTAWDTPQYESTCTYTIASADGGETKTFTETIGESDVLTPDVEATLETMKKNEICKITTPSDEVGLVITLKEFNTPPSRFGVDYETRVKEAGVRKEQGNTYYKAKKTHMAIKKYERAIEYLDDETGTDDKQKQVLKDTKLPLYTNLAAAQLFENKNTECIEICTKALDIDGGNVKALVRRAKALNSLDKWPECRKDLDKVLEFDGKNSDALKEMEKLKKKMKAQDAKDKQRFGNMFAKLAKMEAADEQKNPAPQEEKKAEE
eukprot:TRINITY_DN9639_c1_g2_i1.p1 TRINITY_DN9639_c1_g2~~TRINITY_DN9639_c1_g2_i1.p1  ORF type:complete len:422 (+),score=159.79 TRINITY_DN9639_c1_g2_i1:48-1313(+)